jgi:hypothetical protein
MAWQLVAAAEAMVGAVKAKGGYRVNGSNVNDRPKRNWLAVALA